MSDHTPSDVIPPSPSAEDYAHDSAGKPLIPDIDDPVGLFRDWLSAARESEPNDPNAMALATADGDGLPDVRMVLLKAISEDGFTFYSHAGSAKGVQLTARPQAALCFHWKSLRRQVRVRGRVGPVPDAEADAYFASRARASRIGALASDQSRPMASRAEFEARVKAVDDQYEGREDIPRPADWGGYRVVPDVIEFWQDQAFRMHDRLQFTKTNGVWTAVRLYP